MLILEHTPHLCSGDGASALRNSEFLDTQFGTVDTCFGDVGRLIDNVRSGGVCAGRSTFGYVQCLKSDFGRLKDESPGQRCCPGLCLIGHRRPSEGLRSLPFALYARSNCCGCSDSN